MAMPINLPCENQCREVAGCFLDTPQAVHWCDQLDIIDWVHPDGIAVDLKIPFFRVMVQVNEESSGLYCGLKFEEIRADQLVMTGLKSGITIWNNECLDPSLSQMFQNPDFRRDLTSDLTDLVLEHRGDDRDLHIVVARDSNVDRLNSGRRKRTRVCWVVRTGRGALFFNLLDRLRATVFRSLQVRVPPPPCDFHLRFWGCKWCGRVPTADPFDVILGGPGWCTPFCR